MSSRRKKPLKRQIKTKRKGKAFNSKTRVSKKPLEPTFKVKWKSLAKIVKDLKRKRSDKALQKKCYRKLTRKESLDLVPMPSFGILEHGKGRKALNNKHLRFASKCRSSARACKGGSKKHERAQWQKTATKKSRTGGQKSSKVIAELNNLKPKSKKTPFPSSKIPTFIEMVTTAVKDLSKFQMTGRKTISKYIELRYRVRNDELLKFALKWMLKKKILTRTKGFYSIAEKKKSGKKSSKKKKKTKSKSKKKKKKSCKSKKKTNKKCKKKHKCTCAKDMKKKKNLVRMKTRYVRRNGKIYREDEYV